jgi:hypothetical protein
MERILRMSVLRQGRLTYPQGFKAPAQGEASNAELVFTGWLFLIRYQDVADHAEGQVGVF